MPAQILDTLFAPYYWKDGSVPKIMHRQMVTIARPKDHPEYLPNLGCILLTEWNKEPVISAIVAKDDDAAVQTHIWDKQISAL